MPYTGFDLVLLVVVRVHVEMGICRLQHTPLASDDTCMGRWFLVRHTVVLQTQYSLGLALWVRLSRFLYLSYVVKL